MNINFELEAHRAMAPRLKSECLVLSATDIRVHNTEFDQYMEKAYKPEDQVKNEDIKQMAAWVFAVTGKLFVRVVREGIPSQASPPDEAGVQYMVVNEPDFLDLFDITMEVLNGRYFH